MHTSRISCLLSLVTLALFFQSGCTQYEWNRPALPFKTIYVQPVTNSAFVPQAQAGLSTQIRQALIRDGRLKLVNNPAKAGAILQINLIDYERESAVRSSKDSEVALGFDLTLEAEIALFNQSSNEYLFKGRKHRTTTNTFGSDPSSNEDTFHRAEYQAMTRITEDLADEIASAVLEIW